MKRYDVVIIGSGLSGLACGGLLARRGMRVAVLEKHYQIGGYAHSFWRGPFRFESSVHSVPLATKGFIFHLLNQLSIADRVQTIAHPSMYRVISPYLDFTMPSNREESLAELSAAFPRQRSALKAMFDEMHKYFNVFLKPLFSERELIPEKDKEYLSQFADTSYKDFVEGYITDPKLRYIFCSQWPYFGTSAGMVSAPFAFLAFYVHIIEGSHYVCGGFSSLAEAFASYIKEKGGEVRTNACVERLCVEADRAMAVLLQSGEEIEADIFVSNISPYRLHRHIVDEKARNNLWLRRLEKLRPSVSAFAVYIGLADNFSPLSNSNIIFWYDHQNHEERFRQIENNMRRPIDHLFILKTPYASQKETLLLLHYIRQSYSKCWREEKELFARALLHRAEEIIPGLGKNIEYIEIGTPDTFERYTANTAGAILGFENSKSLYQQARLPIKTYIKNLFQTGHWCPPGGGVWNVMECALVASKTIVEAAGL